MPLDVAFHALSQDGEARRFLGIRLLTLVSIYPCQIILHRPFPHGRTLMIAPTVDQPDVNGFPRLPHLPKCCLHACFIASC